MDITRDIWPTRTTENVALSLALDDTGAFGGFCDHRTIQQADALLAIGVRPPARYVAATMRRAAIIRRDA